MPAADFAALEPQYVDGGEGVRIAYRDTGVRDEACSESAKPTLVLVHGVGRSMLDWGGVAAAVSASHRVVALDLRGHGLSSDGDWTLENVMGDLHALVEHVGVTSPLLVGHSIGGILCLEWARERQACGVVNVDGFPAAIDFTGHAGDQAKVLGRALLGQLRVRSSRADHILARLSPSLAGAALGGGGVTIDQVRSRSAAQRLQSDGTLTMEKLVAAQLAALRPRNDGLLVPRLSAATSAQLSSAVKDLDLPALCGRSGPPVLLVDATKYDLEAQELGLPWLAGQVARRRASCIEDVNVRAAQVGRSVRTTHVAAGHGLLLTHPSQVGGLVLGFAGELTAKQR